VDLLIVLTIFKSISSLLFLAKAMKFLYFITWFVMVSAFDPWDLPLWPGWKPDQGGNIVDSTTAGTEGCQTEVTTGVVTKVTVTEAPPRRVTTFATTTVVMTTTTVAAEVVVGSNAGFMTGVAVGVSVLLVLICCSLGLCYYYRKVLKVRVNNVQLQVGLNEFVYATEDGSCAAFGEDELVSYQGEPTFDMGVLTEGDDIIVEINRQGFGSVQYGKVRTE